MNLLLYRLIRESRKKIQVQNENLFQINPYSNNIKKNPIHEYYSKKLTFLFSKKKKKLFFFFKNVN